MKTNLTNFSNHGLMILALLLCGGLIAFAQTPTLRANGKIAFTSYRDGNPEIYVINSDSTNHVRLTNNPGVDDHATWSPDGTKIAFVSDRPAGGFAIFIMNADGTNKAEITPLNSYFGYPIFWDGSSWTQSNVYWSMSWSPDGKRIVFQDNVGLVIVKIDDGSRQVLTDGIEPSWSPDGSRILFSRYISDANHIYGGNILHTIKPDGTDLRELPNGNLTDGWDDWYAKWSPAGDKIVFVVNAWDFAQDLFTANADGTNRQFFDGCNWWDNSCRLNRDNPAWSPDGNWIIYSIEGAIYVKNINGTGPTVFVSGTNASWQPVVSTTCASPNPIDCPDFFIGQQYRDFLNREGEADGLNFYLNILNGCHPSDTECIRYTRGALSANFFRSPEFQAKGSYVMYLYMVTIGQRSVTAAELGDQSKVERPHYPEFIADMSAISSPDDRNGPDPAKKAALTQAFVERAEIVAKYPTSTYPTLMSFGNALASTAGVTLSSSTQNAIAAATTRAQVLQIVAESAEVNAKF